MNVICDANQEIFNILKGPQIYIEGKKYRFNKFCIIEEYEDNILIYNSLTGGLIGLSKLEYKNIDVTKNYEYVNFLISSWFLVTENFDEEYVLDIMRKRQEVLLTDYYLDHPTMFTILTTSACNARCFYCYELGIKKKTHMSKETAEKVADYIIKHTDKRDTISLDWFGGEPLFNSEVIDLICFRVLASGIKFTSSMVSNGYLFDDNIINKAINQWNLTNVQITLDGTEEIYNKTKAYIYKDCESPFKRVIQNIHKLLDTKINVSIRMNCDKHNFEDLIKLVDYLYQEFGKNEYFTLYVWPIFDDESKRTPEERKILYDNIDKIDQHIYDTFGIVIKGINRAVAGVHCMVDRGNAVCIYPKGEIGVCEHYLEDHFVSHIDNPNEKNWDVLKQWRQYTPYGDLCKDCPIRPECIRVNDCPDHKICDEYEKAHILHRARIGIIQELKNYIERLNSGNNDKCGGSCSNPNCGQHDPCYNAQR